MRRPTCRRFLPLPILPILALSAICLFVFSTASEHIRGKSAVASFASFSHVCMYAHPNV